MQSFWNIVLGFCIGATLSAVVLVSSTKELRSRYERSLSSAIESGQFALTDRRGEKASSTALFDHLDISARQADASRRTALLVALTVLFVLATAGAYYKFSS
jgi:hypothetical protein